MAENSDSGTRVQFLECFNAARRPVSHIQHAFSTRNPCAATAQIELAPQGKIVQLRKCFPRPFSKIDLIEFLSNDDRQLPQLCKGLCGFLRSFKRAAVNRLDFDFSKS